MTWFGFLVGWSVFFGNVSLESPSPVFISEVGGWLKDLCCFGLVVFILFGDLLVGSATIGLLLFLLV